MDYVINDTYIKTLIDGYYINFRLFNSSLSAYSVTRNCNDLHTISSLSIPTKIGGLHVVSIEDNAFCEIESLKKVSLPNSITSIGNRAFGGCINLQEITIPGGVKEIGFICQSCDNLTNVTFEEGVENISSSAFRDCENIKQITFPKSIKTIDSNAFNESKLINFVATNGNREAIKFAISKNVCYT